MSHLCSFSVEVERPVPEIAKAAAEAVARVYGGKVYTEAKKDWYVTVDADYVIEIPYHGDVRYIGIKLGEKLEIVGDPYEWRRMFDEVKDKIVQMYVTSALLQQLQQLGYRVENIVENDGNLYAEVIM